MLPKYRNWVSMGFSYVHSQVLKRLKQVPLYSTDAKIIRLTVSRWGCRETTTVLQTASSRRNSWMRCAWVTCRKSLRWLRSGTRRKSSWFSSSCSCVFTRRGTGAPGRSFKFCTETLVTVMFHHYNLTEHVPELSHRHSIKFFRAYGLTCIQGCNQGDSESELSAMCHRQTVTNYMILLAQNISANAI